jgi:Na+/H+ antiporter NhaC
VVAGDGALVGAETTSTSITTTISVATATSELATDHPTCRLAAAILEAATDHPPYRLAAVEILLGGIIRNIAGVLRTETVLPQTDLAG